MFSCICRGLSLCGVQRFLNVDTRDSFSRNVQEKKLFVGFRLTLKFVQLRATSVRHPCTYFSEDTETAVYAWIQMSTNHIYSKISISSWSGDCKHLSDFWMEIDSVSSTSVSSFWLCEYKRWELNKYSNLFNLRD